MPLPEFSPATGNSHYSAGYADALKKWPRNRFGLPMTLYWAGFTRAGRLLAAVVCLSVLTATGVYFWLDPRYDAIATISPVSEQNGLTSGALGLLSAATGANISGASGGNFEKFKSLLHSTRLAAALEQKPGVLRTVFSREWDEAGQRWRTPNPVVLVFREAFGFPWRQPGTYRLSKWLANYVDVTPQADASQGLSALKNQIVVISLRFRNKDEAIKLLSLILTEADEIARQDELINAAGRVDYLQRGIKNTTDINLADSLRKLLLDQERVLMTLKANKNYSVDIIDPPHESTVPARLALGITVVAAAIGALVVCAGFVFIILRRRVDRFYETSVDPLAEPFPDPISGMVGALRRAAGVFQNGRKQSIVK